MAIFLIMTVISSSGSSTVPNRRGIPVTEIVRGEKPLTTCLMTGVWTLMSATTTRIIIAMTAVRILRVDITATVMMLMSSCYLMALLVKVVMLIVILLTVLALLKMTKHGVLVLQKTS
jgi:hypothetical protein